MFINEARDLQELFYSQAVSRMALQRREADNAARAKAKKLGPPRVPFIDTRPPFGRQQKRAEDRRQRDAVAAKAADEIRRLKRNITLRRQAEREKAGFYTGPSVAAALAGKRSGRLHRRILIDDTGKAKRANLTRLA